MRLCCMHAPVLVIPLLPQLEWHDIKEGAAVARADAEVVVEGHGYSPTTYHVHVLLVPSRATFWWWAIIVLIVLIFLAVALLFVLVTPEASRPTWVQSGIHWIQSNTQWLQQHARGGGGYAPLPSA
ncbi:unnamed protein product [Closterium sp. Yama58-4]|nr:unnamed protein product [Closterium sp. Yama58-4]